MRLQPRHWAGHLQYMKAAKMPKRILKGKICGRGSKLRERWEDPVDADNEMLLGGKKLEDTVAGPEDSLANVEGDQGSK